MRKIYLFNLISLDGFFSRPNGDLDWHNVDDEFQEFAVEQTSQIGLIIFGRKTFNFMASYWPTEEVKKEDPVVAKLMNEMPKAVFSKTLKSANWENSTLYQEVEPGLIKKLKEQPGKDIAIFGSANLATTFTNLGLIDEYRIMVNPLLLAEGVPLFQNLEKEIKLKLDDTRTFKNGNILLTYKPVLK